MSTPTLTNDHPAIKPNQIKISPPANRQPPTLSPPLSTSTHWILSLFFLTLATIFGYRTVLVTCLVLPFYLFSFLVLLIILNVGISYWIQYQDHSASPSASNLISSFNRDRNVLYDRLSFSTPAAYSAAMIKRTWENQTEWRKQPLHPSLKQKTSTVLDRMIAKIMRDFVWKWYNEIVPPPNANLIPSGSQDRSDPSSTIESYSSSAFPFAVEKTIRHSLRVLFDRFGKIDLANLIIHKILPILTTHIEAFRQAEYDLRGGTLSAHDHSHRPRSESRARLYRAFFSSGNDEIDLLLSRLHADVLRRKSQESQSNGPVHSGEIKPASRLHPAVDIPTPNSQSAELAHLKKLLESLLPLILPTPESESTSIKTLLVELIACVVIAPVIEMLSDSDFLNRLIEERAGNVIREQKMVEQLRQVLDRQLSFVTNASKVEASGKHPRKDPLRRPRSASLTQINQLQATNLTKPNRALEHEFTSAESISIKTTAKEFERFSRSIQRCNTLFDVRRLKNDVETQIRKTEVELMGCLETEPFVTDKNLQPGTYLESTVFNPPNNSQSDLTKFLERLSAVKDILDQRLAELGGSSGPVKNSWSFDLGGNTDLNSSSSHQVREGLHKHMPNRKPNQILQEILRDRESPALSYFTEFMDRRQRVKLIQFWLAVEGLKNPLEEDLISGGDNISVHPPGRSNYAKPHTLSIQDGATNNRISQRDLDAMAADIKAIAEINFSTVEAIDLLGLKEGEVLPLLRFLSLDLAQKYESSIPLQPNVPSKSVNIIYSIKDARATLFSMQRKVFDLMLSEDFPAFAAVGDLYLRATASLCDTKPSNGLNASPAGLISAESFPNLVDLKSSSKARFGFSPSHKHSIVVKPRHFSDPDFPQPSPLTGLVIPQPDEPVTKDLKTSSLVRANSFSGSLPQVDSQLSPENNCNSPLSVVSSEALAPAQVKDMRKSSPYASNIIHTVLRSHSTDVNQHLRRIAPSPVPPQVTFQEAFDERLPGERLTGPIHYNESLFSLSNTFSDHLPSSESTLKIQPSHLMHATKFSMSSSLDFLISPSKGDRAPLFEDDLNFSIRKAPYARSVSLTPTVKDQYNKVLDNNAQLGNTTDQNQSASEPASRTEEACSAKHQLLTPPDAAIALQEALTSIISTSDRSPRPTFVPSPHDHSCDSSERQRNHPSFSSSVKQDMNSDTPGLSSKIRHTHEKSGLFKLSHSTPSSPFSKPSQRKRLFDDDDEEDDEEDDNDLSSFESNNKLSSKRRKNTSLSRETVVLTSVQSTPAVSNVSEADERIMKLENELNLLSSLMRRAELTGNKLEIRLVRKSIESVGRELSEVIYRKTKLIEQREILLGGFRGKLVPGRVKISISGTTIGNSNSTKDDTNGHHQLSYSPISPHRKKLASLAMNKKSSNPHPSVLNVLGANHNNGSQHEFVLYKVEIHKLAEDGSFGSGWIVYRRYSEFDQLNKTLKELYPISRQLDFPTKIFGLGITTAGIAVSVNVPSAPNVGNTGSSKSNFNQSLIDQRRVGLERYLKALIQIPVLCESPELAKFLSRSKNHDSLSTSTTKGGVGIGMDSLTSLKKRIEFFSSTTGFVRSIYKSIMASSSTNSANVTDSTGSRILISSEEDNSSVPIGSSTAYSLSHTLSPSPSFSFSSQSLVDVFMKGFNKNYLPTHHHPPQENLNEFGDRYDRVVKDSIEFNEIKKKEKKKLREEGGNEEEVDEDEDEEEEDDEGYVNVEHDRLIDLTNNFKPMEGELLTNFTKPISNFLIEIFELNDQNQWLRKQGIVIVLQQILGGTIERKFKESISELLEDEQLSQIITNLEQSIWFPDNDENDDEKHMGELRPKLKPRSIEEKIMTCDGAYRKLSVIMPDYAASILGRSNARMATRRLFSMFQNRRLNKHLIYTILDEVIKTLFPELSNSL